PLQHRDERLPGLLESRERCVVAEGSFEAEYRREEEDRRPAEDPRAEEQRRGGRTPSRRGPLQRAIEDFQSQASEVLGWMCGGVALRRRIPHMQAGTLITPRLAEEAINSRLTCLPIESLPLTQCVSGTLRENIYAERDQPPFDRVSMDGIAIDSEAARRGLRHYRIQATQ